MLPQIKKDLKLDFTYFPTKIHAVVFRLWDMVAKERIAVTLKTTPEKISKVAESMGLETQKNTDEWVKKGYLTIIKALWHLLPYEQITEILGWSEEKLDFILKEDDFFAIKLGNIKPFCEPVYYREITEEEKEKVSEIRKIVKDNFSFNDDYIPFDFFSKKYKPFETNENTSVNPDEIIINSEWCIEDNTNDSLVSLYVSDFKDEIKKIHGFSFSENSDKKIVLDFSENSSEDEEYHEIDIKEDYVRITSPKPFGIFRALNFILERNSLTFTKKLHKIKPVFKTRYIYSFCGLYTTVLDADSEISFPDALLKEYAKCKINGIWLQGILYKLTKFPFSENLSDGYEKRIENLIKLTKRAERYGIRVYMYLNEPRAMHESFFEKNPQLSDLKGHRQPDGNVSLCTSNEKVRKYLSDAVGEIVEKVPSLGGIFVITASENQTNCRFMDDTNCPVCQKRKTEDVISEVINVMAEAAFNKNKNIKFFAWDWGWKSYFNFNTDKIIKKLIPGVIIQSVSEDKMTYEKGGIKGELADYSLSMAGPSEATKALWKNARKENHEVSAKVQLNNSWECSTAPFLPVYDTVLTHLKNLITCDVNHIMLSWTLGGYPSDNIKIASGFFFSEGNENYDEIYNDTLKNVYGKYSDCVKKAATHFSKAFSEFPFHVHTLYCGPQNSGASNLLFEKETGFPATMTCFPYDDLEYWRSIYPEDIFRNQYEKICIEWEKGLEIIKEMPECEFKEMAEYGYTLFKSSLNQIDFILIRNKDEKKKIKIAEDEFKLAIKTYNILKKNPSIGFEAANHYYVCPSMLIEKALNCNEIINKRGKNK